MKRTLNALIPNIKEAKRRVIEKTIKGNDVDDDREAEEVNKERVEKPKQNRKEHKKAGEKEVTACKWVPQRK